MIAENGGLVKDGRVLELWIDQPSDPYSKLHLPFQFPHGLMVTISLEDGELGHGTKIADRPTILV